MPNFLEETQIFHLGGNSQTPSIEEVNEGIASTFVQGSDEAGVITIETGAITATGMTLFYLEFSKPFKFADGAPFAILYPASEDTKLLTAARMVYINYDTSTNQYLDFRAGSVALAPFTAYTWVYHVMARNA